MCEECEGYHSAPNALPPSRWWLFGGGGAKHDVEEY